MKQNKPSKELQNRIDSVRIKLNYAVAQGNIGLVDAYSAQLANLQKEVK